MTDPHPSPSPSMKTGSRVRALALALACLAILLPAFAPAVSAETVIAESGSGAGQVSNPERLALDTSTGSSYSGRLYVADRGNHRVDVFDSSGHFLMAWGWGVADGHAELETCTTVCRKGLTGGGAGELTSPEDIAVDNSSTSPSQHDVYVLDCSLLQNGESFMEGRGDRVEEFGPSGEFIVAFGGGVITAGATGTGTLSEGSNVVTGVVTTEKTFEAGQTIVSAGKIPSGTKIAAVGPENQLTLSQRATASGSATLSVAAGPGNITVNEVQEITLNPNLGHTADFNLKFTTPEPSPTSATTQSIPAEATAELIQSELEALPNIGAGNVDVTGHQGGPFLVEFTGTRFADTNVGLYSGGSAVERILTVRNGDSSAEICTAAIATSCADGVEGAEGTSHGRFIESHEGVRLSVGPDGDVYVADCVTPVGTIGTQQTGGKPQCENRLQEFEPTGAFIKALALPQSEYNPSSLAVNSAGDFYVTTLGGELFGYDSSATTLPETFPAVDESLTLDSFDDLFVSEAGPIIGEYDSGGKPVRRFGYGEFRASRPPTLAPTSSSTGIYYAEQNAGRIGELDFPAPGPIARPQPCQTTFLGNTKATLQAEVNPEGKSTTFNFEYVTDAEFIAKGFVGAASTTDTVISVNPAHEEEQLYEMQKVDASASVVPETKYHCRVVATNADNTAGVVGQEGSFTSLPPLQVGATWVGSVGTEAATLNVEINPLGISTTGYFEYVDEVTYLADTEKAEEEGESSTEVREAGFAHATVARRGPLGEEPLSFGEGEGLVANTSIVNGLVAGTSYRYRVVASDTAIAPREIPGPTEAFRTYLPGEGLLPDRRAYEMVSPPRTTTADFAVGQPLGGALSNAFYRLIDAGATSGEAVTYTSWTSIGAAEGAPGTSQYLSKRTESGWQTENITPYGLERILIPPYRGFNPELELGAFVVTEPALTPEASEGIDNLYLRNDRTDALQALTNAQPTLSFMPGKAEFCLDYAGSSEDGTRAFFAANASYAGAPVPVSQGFNLYEWSAVSGLRAVSVLPGQSSPVGPTAGNAFGAAGEHCETGEKIARHVISSDGSRAFWTYAPGSGPTELLVRVNGSETLQLDKRIAGAAGSSGGGVFQAASADGSVSFFTDTSRLTASAGAEEGAPDLYRYELPGKKLEDVTPSALTSGSEAADIVGVVGASDDGSYIYFVAQGALSGEEGAAREKARAGAFNLYVYHEGKVGFIAILSGEDSSDWISSPLTLSARVSADGRHLAFLSRETENLAGYDNTVSDRQSPHCQMPAIKGQPLRGSPLCPEAFLYDAESKQLSCVSCNPTGARPLGPSLLPGWSNPYEGPRYLSNDGRRLFFETLDSLTLADTSGKRDVYEFERAGSPGEGSCATGSPSFDPSADGCQFLISGGTSSDESYFVDASGEGRDVFFSTRQSLAAGDTNENYDVYDAREGGGFVEPPPPPPPCEGEASCRSPLSAPPSFFAPASAGFYGPGNLVQEATDTQKPPAKKQKAKPHKQKKKKKKRRKHPRSTLKLAHKAGGSARHGSGVAAR